MNSIAINNQIIPEKEALISVQERGFRFGDGIFETCKISDGIIYNWDAHFRRLNDGLKAIKITANLDELKNSAEKLIKKNHIKNGILRISVSRGIGSMGYLPKENITPLIIIETLTPPEFSKNSINLWVSKYTKPSLKSLPVNYKLMQGLNSTLVKIEAKENDCFDAIILNDIGEICETSSANIFWIKDNILHTPHANCGILLGTVREKIINFSPLKIKLTKASLTELKNADEMFLTNTNIGVLAVDKISPLNKTFGNKKYHQTFADLLNSDISNYVAKAKA